MITGCTRRQADSAARYCAKHGYGQLEFNRLLNLASRNILNLSEEFYDDISIEQSLQGFTIPHVISRCKLADGK